MAADGFDLSTAKPVTDSDTGGFDLSTAKPIVAKTPAPPEPISPYYSPQGMTPGVYMPPVIKPGSAESQKGVARGVAGVEGLAMGAAGPLLVAGQFAAPETTKNIEKGYKETRAKAGESGFDLPRAAGESVYGGLMKGVEGGSYLARLARNASKAALVTGATVPTEGKTNPPTEGKTNPFVEKAVQMGEAFGGAAILMAGSEGLARGAAAAGRVAGRVYDKMGNVLKEKIGVPLKEAGSATKGAVENLGQQILKAKKYVEEELNLEWKSLKKETRKKFLDIVKSSGDLSGLDAESARKAAFLESKGVEATRGQVTRDLQQLSIENLYAKTEEFAQRRARQDAQLHDWLTGIRKEVAPNSRLTRSEQAGNPVETALNYKETTLRKAAERSRQLAQQIGELSKPISHKPLTKLIDSDPILSTDLSGIRTIIDKYSKGGETITIEQAEKINRRLNRILTGADTIPYESAITAKNALNKMLDNAGSSAYKTYRKDYRAISQEFEQNTLIRSLTSNKTGMLDKKVATENALKLILNKSTGAEQIDALRKSLTTGGNESTRTLGQTAWQELQHGVLLDLQEKATASAANTKSMPAFIARFRSAVEDLEYGGRLEKIFPPKIVKQIRELDEAVSLVRQIPGEGKVGSDTAMNETVRELHHMGAELAASTKIPFAEKFVNLALKRQGMAKAAESPLSEAARKARSGGLSERANNTLRSLQPALVRAYPAEQAGQSTEAQQ